MKYINYSSSLFNKNREKLLAQMANNSLVILFSADEYPRNGDQYFPFRQNSDFFYLTGIDQENSALLMYKNADGSVFSCKLFIKKTDKTQEIWFGKKLHAEDAYNISGIKEVFWIDDFDHHLIDSMDTIKNVYIWQNEYAKFETEVPYDNLRKSNELMKEYPKLNFLRLFPVMEKLRIIKSAEELEMMRKAVAITKNAYLRVLKKLKPGMKEYEVEADITYEFLRSGASGHSYSPIIAAGENACILHYCDNDKMLSDGQLLLMDFGAEYGNYAADCSRTIPVNGKFSQRQKDCYEAVLYVFKNALKLYIPGNTIDIINIKVGEWMQEKLLQLGLLSEEEIKNHTGEHPPYFKYYMHGTSHFIGLDVHDVGSKQTVFEKGMVLTCEPGIYIPEEKIGIRIETDIVVDDVPIDLMADYPVEIAEIEAAMRR